MYVVYSEPGRTRGERESKGEEKPSVKDVLWILLPLKVPGAPSCCELWDLAQDTSHFKVITREGRVCQSLVKSYFQGPLIFWQSAAWWQHWPQFPDKATDKGRQASQQKSGWWQLKGSEQRKGAGTDIPWGDTAQIRVPLAQPPAPA